MVARLGRVATVAQAEPQPRAPVVTVVTVRPVVLQVQRELQTMAQPPVEPVAQVQLVEPVAQAEMRAPVESMAMAATVGPELRALTERMAALPLRLPQVARAVQVEMRVMQVRAVQRVRDLARRQQVESPAPQVTAVTAATAVLVSQAVSVSREHRVVPVAPVVPQRSDWRVPVA